MSNDYTDTPQEWANALERRNRVLKYPQIAARLCDPPFSLPDPRMWSGYIPPAEWRGEHNNSPIRRQIIAICNMVIEQEKKDAESPVRPAMVDEQGLTALHTAFYYAGIEDRDEKLLYCQSIIGHPVESSKDLTAEEAYACRKQLHAIEQQERRHENAPASQAPKSEPEHSGDDYRPWAERPEGQVGKPAETTELPPY